MGRGRSNEAHQGSSEPNHGLRLPQPCQLLGRVRPQEGFCELSLNPLESVETESRTGRRLGLPLLGFISHKTSRDGLGRTKGP